MDGTVAQPGNDSRVGAQNWVVRAPDFRSELRGAVYRGDGPAVVALVGDQLLPGDALQLIGDGLVVALALQTQGAADLAVACVRALRERGWDGDDELADQLGALLGTGPTPLLRPLPVDLEELAGVLEGDPTFGGGRLDLLTGQVWPQAAIDYARETGEEDEDESDDADRWLWVHCEGSRAGYHDMVQFIGTVDDRDRADRLGIAIEGRGAFRRFKDVLARWPGELDRWYGYADDRQRGRARAWLADAANHHLAAGQGRPRPWPVTSGHSVPLSATAWEPIPTCCCSQWRADPDHGAPQLQVMRGFGHGVVWPGRTLAQARDASSPVGGVDSV